MRRRPRSHRGSFNSKQDRNSDIEDFAVEIDELIEGGLVDKAHEIAMACSTAYPRNTAALKLLARTSTEVGDFIGAERAATMLCSLCPDDTFSLTLLIACYAKKGYAALALRTMDRLSGIDPRLTQTETMAQLRENCTEHARLSMQIFSRNGLETLADYEEVISLRDINDIAGARRLAEVVQRRNPTDPIAQNHIVSLDMIEGNIGAALESARKTLNIDPDDVFALALIIRCQRLLGSLPIDQEPVNRLKAVRSGWSNARSLAVDGFLMAREYQAVLQVYESPASEAETLLETAMITHQAAVASLHLGDEGMARSLWNHAQDLVPGSALPKQNLDDLEKPVGSRFGPVSMELGHILPNRAVEALQDVIFRASTRSAP